MKHQLQEKQIKLENYQTVYLEEGVTHSETILFLHGWTIATDPYQETLHLLSQYYHVIAPDLPGFGKTSFPTAVPDYNGYVECITSFLKALNLKKVHVVGHSGGGAVGVVLAANFPELVKSLILIDSTGIPLGFLPEVALRRLIDFPAQIGRFKFEPTFLFMKALISNWIFKTQNMFQASWIALEKDLRPLLPQVQCPTLIVWGDRDLFIPVKCAYEFSQGIPHSQLIMLEDEYHEWIFYHEEKCINIIANFINEAEL
ncbi:alpha/beta hydrolase [Gloeocapsopsis crepidinum LEGE 06123]|uniref:Alpha/beta hydrolase n=1 Tax=Gloeocapsopsis crepidinum LEGE 06123 TaxID=588587 RepID=A0ABR9ULG3_9CHRO|nr:alpha/beta hydrolase [Gloeocapsopsis crepidinum]MBE9189126.1 alpha/beta hydrolase [Gloeocapsopsis crepidinum LEGE 06123]